MNMQNTETTLDAARLSSRIPAIPPDIPVPAEGYFTFKEVVQHGLLVSVPLSKGIMQNDILLFAMSTDGMLLYTVYRIITTEHIGKIEFHLPGEAFAHSLGQLLHFAYNIERDGQIIMESLAVGVPLRE